MNQQADNAISTRGGITEAPSAGPLPSTLLPSALLSSTQGQNHYSSAVCGLDSGKIRVFEDCRATNVRSESAPAQDHTSKATSGLLETPIEDRYIEEDDRTLEDYARAIQRYREEYELACTEAAYDAVAEQAYRAQRAQHGNQPKPGPPLLRCSGIELERKEWKRRDAHTRRDVWPKEVLRGVRLAGRHKPSRKMKGAAAAFIVVFTLTVTPLVHARIFSTSPADAFNWIFSAECSAYVAALIAWSILRGRNRNRRRYEGR